MSPIVTNRMIYGVNERANTGVNSNITAANNRLAGSERIGYAVTTQATIKRLKNTHDAPDRFELTGKSMSSSPTPQPNNATDSAESVLFAGQSTLLYGNEGFRVRDVTIQPEEYYHGQLQGRRWTVIPVTGTLSASSGGANETPVVNGQPLELPAEKRYAIRNLDKTESARFIIFEHGYARNLGDVNVDIKPLGDVTETRPWGSFTVIADEPAFKLKQLVVKPGQRLSEQRHQQREEHWFVTGGSAHVAVGESTTAFKNEEYQTHQSGDYVFIPRQSWHRLANQAEQNPTDANDVTIIELQLGSYFGEDDIERRGDDYNRN